MILPSPFPACKTWVTQTHILCWLRWHIWMEFRPQFLFTFLTWECCLLFLHTLGTLEGHKRSQVTPRRDQWALIITSSQLAKAAADGTLHPPALCKWHSREPGYVCACGCVCVSFQSPFYEWNSRLCGVHSWKRNAYKALPLGINQSWVKLIWLV